MSRRKVGEPTKSEPFIEIKRMRYVRGRYVCVYYYRLNGGLGSVIIFNSPDNPRFEQNIKEYLQRRHKQALKQQATKRKKFVESNKCPDAYTILKMESWINRDPLKYFNVYYKDYLGIYRRIEVPTTKDELDVFKLATEKLRKLQKKADRNWVKIKQRGATS